MKRLGTKASRNALVRIRSYMRMASEMPKKDRRWTCTLAAASFVKLIDSEPFMPRKWLGRAEILDKIERDLAKLSGECIGCLAEEYRATVEKIRKEHEPWHRKVEAAQARKAKKEIQQ